MYSHILANLLLDDDNVKDFAQMSHDLISLIELGIYS